MNQPWYRQADDDVYPHVPRLTHVVSTLLALSWQRPYWVGTPDRMFRPKGLLLVDAPAGARLLEWSVGADRVLPMGEEPLPVSVLTFLERLDPISNWGMASVRPWLSTCDAGMRIRLSLVSAAGEPLGPPLEPVIWGQVPRSL